MLVHSEMFSRVPENLSRCNFSLFLLAIFTGDGEQFITLLSELVDAVLEENYDSAFLFLSHTSGSHPKHTTIYSNIFTSLKGNTGDNLSILGL